MILLFTFLIMFTISDNGWQIYAQHGFYSIKITNFSAVSLHMPIKPGQNYSSTLNFLSKLCIMVCQNSGNLLMPRTQTDNPSNISSAITVVNSVEVPEIATEVSDTTYMPTKSTTETYIEKANILDKLKGVFGKLQGLEKIYDPTNVNLSMEANQDGESSNENYYLDEFQFFKEENDDEELSDEDFPIYDLPIDYAKSFKRRLENTFKSTIDVVEYTEDCSRLVGVNIIDFCKMVNEESILNTDRSGILEDCKEIKKQGQSKSGIYPIQPNGSVKPYMVFCEMETEGGGWTVLQKRFNGFVGFFKSWRDYKHGFGDLNNEFWIGNELIHHITAKRKTTLLIELYNDDIKDTYTWDDFGISAEKEGYTIEVLGDFKGIITSFGALEKVFAHGFFTKNRQTNMNKANSSEVLYNWSYAPVVHIDGHHRSLEFYIQCSKQEAGWWWSNNYAEAYNTKTCGGSKKKEEDARNMGNIFLGGKKFCYLGLRMLVRHDDL